jgi:hypothetical protein
MPVKFRPSGLDSGIDDDRTDDTAYSGGWDVGRMYETRGPDDTIEPRGAVSEESRRMEGLGEAGGN